MAINLVSCASLFNERTVKVKIITNKPCALILNEDTLKNKTKYREIFLERSKKTVELKLVSDSSTNVAILKSQYSLMYLANIIPVCDWLGFLIDIKTKKKYSYPSLVYVDFTKNDSTFLKYIPLEERYANKKQIIKITPLKPFQLVNPSLEFCYERKLSKKFSTQLMASYQINGITNSINSFYNPHYKGYRTAIEQRCYFYESALQGPYFSLEFNFLNVKYNSAMKFYNEEAINDTTLKYEPYDLDIKIKKQTYSWNLKFGYQYIHERVAVEAYFGLGLRYKNVLYLNKLNDIDIPSVSRHPNIGDISDREGKYWGFCIPLNFRVGYTF